MQTFFAGFIIYLLALVGCNQNDVYSTPSPSEQPEIFIESNQNEEQYLTAYDKSLMQWEEDKKKHNDSYQYVLSYTAAEGHFMYSTTITVKEGVITQRDYKMMDIHYNAKTSKKTFKITKSWSEKGKQIGKNTVDFPALPKTLDEVYYDCGNVYLTDLTPDDHVDFDTEHDGLISICGSTNINCADDCFEGIQIESITWLE